ncbi:MAG: hypothetical protein WBB64_14780 [Anaerolineales bacterium]
MNKVFLLLSYGVRAEQLARYNFSHSGNLSLKPGKLILAAAEDDILPIMAERRYLRACLEGGPGRPGSFDWFVYRWNYQSLSCPPSEPA